MCIFHPGQSRPTSHRHSLGIIHPGGLCTCFATGKTKTANLSNLTLGCCVCQGYCPAFPISHGPRGPLCSPVRRGRRPTAADGQTYAIVSGPPRCTERLANHLFHTGEGLEGLLPAPARIWSLPVPPRPPQGQPRRACSRPRLQPCREHVPAFRLLL